MERRLTLAASEARLACERASATAGLGELQALREIQAERCMRNNLARSRRFY